ncbi:MAG: hypothetical protein J6U21_05710, partial [Bacteroidales bacterium]|nr:hypothetical protein [Bacteroidales bacterium]
YPLLRITFGGKNEGRPEETINAVEFIGDKSFRARGKRVSNYEVVAMKFEHNPDAPAEPEPTDSEDNPEDWEDPEFEVVRVDEDGQTTMNLM